jgi:hypothetical protein
MLSLPASALRPRPTPFLVPQWLLRMFSRLLTLHPLTSTCLPVVLLVSSSSISATTASPLVRILPIAESHLADPTHSTAAALSSALVAAAISDVTGAPRGTTKKRAVPF